MKQIIGVVGPIASGKGVLVRILQEKGYNVLSLSDVVRQRTKEWGLPMTRENLQNVGDSLRQKFGSAFLAQSISPYIHKRPAEKFVIDAIRNPAEVEFLKKHFHAYIIGITALPGKRFQLMQKRQKSLPAGRQDCDPKTWEAFQKAEARDRGVGQKTYGQQVEACLALADVILDNNGTLEDFENNVPYFIEKNL